MDGAMISTNAGFRTFFTGADRTSVEPASSTDGKQTSVAAGQSAGPVSGETGKEQTPAPAAAAGTGADAAVLASTREQMGGRDVIATDEDGDTLAVSKSASSDGNVVKTRDTGDTAQIAARTENVMAEEKAAEDTRKAAELAAEADGGQTEKITSFIGLSDQQLEVDYLQGKISRYDYDTEMASREKLKEEAVNSAAKAAEDGTELSAIDSDSERVMKAAASASAEKGSDGMTGNGRLDAAENFVTEADSEKETGGAFGKAALNTGDRTVKEEQKTTAQEADRLLRGEERIQWQFQ